MFQEIAAINAQAVHGLQPEINIWKWRCCWWCCWWGKVGGAMKDIAGVYTTGSLRSRLCKSKLGCCHQLGSTHWLMVLALLIIWVCGSLCTLLGGPALKQYTTPIKGSPSLHSVLFIALNISLVKINYERLRN
jgi:hypothetical protein